jgi:Uma2 family endonuclease
MPKPRGRATYADIEALPEHLVGEILNGELIVSPRPALPHANASSVLGSRVNARFHRPGAPGGGWWILDEPELRLREDVLVPDLAGWRRERLPRLPHAARIELAPDWVCEVISEGTRRVDRSRKMAAYARERVPHLWLVEPLAKTLEVFRLENERWSLLAVYEGEAKVRAEPFDAEEIDLAELWLPDEEPPAGQAPPSP